MSMSRGAIIDKAKSIGIRQGDLLVVALLLVLSLVMLGFTLCGDSQGRWVRVCVNGEETAVLSLDRDTLYEVPGGMGNVVEISGGRARMLTAHCPDGSCVGQGYISRAGECVVCLPARVTVTVTAEDGSEGLDAVAF